MLKTIKNNLWSVICSAWALIIALFWLAMRVIWSGISKVIADFAVEARMSAKAEIHCFICKIFSVTRTGYNSTFSTDSNS